MVPVEIGDGLTWVDVHMVHGDRNFDGAMFVLDGLFQDGFQDLDAAKTRGIVSMRFDLECCCRD